MGQTRGLTRRSFLKATAGIAGAGLAGLASARAERDNDGPDVEEEKPMTEPEYTHGEPYEPLGQRIPFTNWLYVRPGSFRWFDRSGRDITVSGSASLYEGVFRRWDLPTGIQLTAERARKTGPVFEPGAPWEDPREGFSVANVIQDGALYRAWSYHAYLESDDGINWRRPLLGIRKFDGQDTNLLDFNVHNGTVFIDPSAPESERFKWVKEAVISPEEFEEFRKRRPDAWDPRAFRRDVNLIFAVKGAVSPDGIHWTMLPEPLVVEHSDTQVTAYYDVRLQKYVVYTRNYMIAPRSGRDPEKGFRVWWESARRSIGRTESSDFRRFPLSERIIEPGPDMHPADLLYTNCRTSFPGAPDFHLIFPAVWHAAMDDSTSVVVYSSPDGKVWNRLPGGPVFETGPCGEWDGGCVFAHPNLIELANGDFALPYTGYDVPHKYPRGQWQIRTGYAVWPKGRLIALEAKESGSFATVSIMPPGRKLFLNALTRRAGKITVEVARHDGTPIPGRSFDESDPVIGDHHRAAVTWRGEDDLGHPDGQPVFFRFRLDRAKLYWVEFE